MLVLEALSHADNLFVLLLWPNARDQQARILEDARELFDVKSIVELHWTDRRFSENLTRFYGTLLPAGSSKEVHCGRGPMLVAVVADPAPTYEYRQTSNGLRLVNKNIFDAKNRYRSWTGGGHRVHASNDPREGTRDLALLFGEDLSKRFAQGIHGQERVHRDLPGAAGWASLDELFRTLNATINFAVLRNFDGLPDQATLEGHDDVDLLVESFDDARLLLNASLVWAKRGRVHVRVNVAGEQVRMDLRHVGDRYYDQTWERNILLSRQLQKAGFFVPDSENHFYSLLYHALIHKSSVSDDYRSRLSNLAVELGVDLNWKAVRGALNSADMVLGRFLTQHGYTVTKPRDPSVRFTPSRELRKSSPRGTPTSRRQPRTIVRCALRRLRLLEPARRLKQWLRPSGT